MIDVQGIDKDADTIASALTKPAARSKKFTAAKYAGIVLAFCTVIALGGLIAGLALDRGADLLTWLGAIGVTSAGFFGLLTMLYIGGQASLDKVLGEAAGIITSYRGR